MARNLSDKLAGTRVGSMFFKSNDVSDTDVKKEQVVAQVAQTRLTAPAVFSSGGVSSVLPSSIPTSFTPSLASNVDPEVRAKIQAIADGADQVSYTKFKELIRNMSSASGDEASCYRMAFAAGKAFNLPASEVLRGVDAILNELSQAERKFNEAAPQRIASKINARREKIAQINQSIFSKRNELQRWQEQINRLNNDLSLLAQSGNAEQAAISQDEQSVRDDAAKFSAALEVVKAPYVAERQKIELYGKGA